MKTVRCHYCRVVLAPAKTKPAKFCSQKCRNDHQRKPLDGIRAYNRVMQSERRRRLKETELTSR